LREQIGNMKMDSHRIPSWQDLCQLPLRAIVACAVRHARRVQPLLQSNGGLHDTQFQMVDDHLEAVECFCRAEPVSGADFIAADQAVRESCAEAGERAFFAAKTVTGTFRAVRHAMDTGAWSAEEGGTGVVPPDPLAESPMPLRATEIDDDTADALVAILAARAARSAEVPWDAEEVAHVVAQAVADAHSAASAAGGQDVPYNPADDFQRLATLALGAFPALGKPIDPSDRGPLGKLWSGTSPPWCIRQRKLW
jgi:hypothetical protein